MYASEKKYLDFLMVIELSCQSSIQIIEKHVAICGSRSDDKRATSSDDSSDEAAPEPPRLQAVETCSEDVR